MSTTTIIRLCHKLKLDGYSHLKYFIREQLKYAENQSQQKPQRTVDQILDEEISDINKTAQLINRDDITAIAELMKNNYRVHFFAKGLTELVFDYTARHLLSLSRVVSVYHDTHIAYIQSEHLGENDLVFLASMSGETEQVVRVAQIARSQKATVVAFSENPNSSLAKLGNYYFQLVSDAKKTCEIDTKSRCQLMLLLTTIVHTLV